MGLTGLVWATECIILWQLYKSTPIADETCKIRLASNPLGQLQSSVRWFFWWHVVVVVTCALMPVSHQLRLIE